MSPPAEPLPAGSANGTPSPAERHAAARRRRAAASTELGRFAGDYAFPLDPFQVEACEALERGHGVLVAAPTGAGKTVVGEFAVHLALRSGRKCFYTTPIKALSNQKYADLAARHGEASVGLLTGDSAVNGDAPVVVMTTEVLRNMLYAQSDALRGLGFVVMDEVHYLADRFRGAVWEEVIIHLPEDVRLVSLSATVSNAEEFGAWLVSVRGDTRVVVEEHRPVPLWQHVLLGTRLVDLFVDDAQQQVNPVLLRHAREERQWRGDDDRGHRRPGRGGHRPRPARLPSRVDVLADLDREGLLPAITFVFSRAGCDAAVAQCLRAGVRLTTEEEAAEVVATVDRRTRDLPDEDLAVLGFHEWLEGLRRGVAAHHAGMLPVFKQVTEELFSRGLVKAVFATETLALGINMPARSVVLERLSKWNGESHADVTPGEYTQLTGRAGRRGIDVEGHAVVLWQAGLDPQQLAGLASTRTYPLRSSFRPGYNMAVNLVGWVGRDRARELLEQSFAQFQSDAAVVGLARQVRRNEEALAGYAEAMRCHLGDFAEYSGLRRALTDLETRQRKEAGAARRAQAASSLERLRPGDVIRVPTGRRAGLAVVLEAADPGEPSGRPLVLTAERQVTRLSVVDVPTPVEPVQRLRIPRGFNPRSAQARRDLASTLRAKVDDPGPQRRGGRGGGDDDGEVTRLRAALRAHPCHGCAEREDHARWAERWQRLRRDTDGLQQRVNERTHTIARTFDRVLAVLSGLGYLDGDEVTDAGRRLSRIYGELDLLTAEAATQGLFDGLAPADLAAVVAALVFEGREREPSPPRLPGGSVRPALDRLSRLWAELESHERDHRLSFLRPLDLGFCWAAWRWASGHRLEPLLTETGLSAGDFVRWVRQLLDLLDQLAKLEPDGPLATTARAALRSLNRGVVAYSGA